MKKLVYCVAALVAAQTASAQRLSPATLEAVQIAAQRNHLNEGELIRLRAVAAALVYRRDVPAVARPDFVPAPTEAPLHEAALEVLATVDERFMPTPEHYAERVL